MSEKNRPVNGPFDPQNEAVSPDGKKRRFAPAQGGMPGRGPGPRGTGQPKPKIKNAKGTIVRLLKYLAGVKWEMIFALSALILTTVTTLITPTISGRIIDILNEGKGSIAPGTALALTFGTYVGTAAIMDRARGQRLKGRLLGVFTQGGIFSVVSYLTLTAVGGEAEAVQAAAETSYTARLAAQLTYLGALYLISTLCSLTQSLLMVRVSQHTVRTIRTDLFGKLQGLPLKYFDSSPHGQLMSRLTNDVDNVSNMLSQTMTQILSSIITFAVCLYMMIRLSWQLTLVSFITIPMSVFIMRAITSRTGSRRAWAK